MRPIPGAYSIARAVTNAADSQVVRHSIRPSSLLAEARANGVQAMRSYQLNEFGVVTSHDAYSTTAVRTATDVGSFIGSRTWSAMPGSGRTSSSRNSIAAMTTQPTIAMLLMMIFEMFQLSPWCVSSPNTGPAQAPAFT